MQIQQDFEASFHFAITQSLIYETGTLFFVVIIHLSSPDYELLGVDIFSYCILVQNLSICCNRNYE